MTLDGMARCTRCRKVKALGQFYRRGNNGHQGYCIECSRAAGKLRHERTRAVREARYNKSAADLKHENALLRRRLFNTRRKLTELRHSILSATE